MLIESALSKEAWISRFRGYKAQIYSYGDCCTGWLNGRFFKLYAKRARDFGMREYTINQVYGRITTQDGKTIIRYFHWPGLPPWALLLLVTMPVGLILFMYSVFSQRGQESIRMLDEHLRFISVPPMPEEKKTVPKLFHEGEQ